MSEPDVQRACDERDEALRTAADRLEEIFKLRDLLDRAEWDADEDLAVIEDLRNKLAAAEQRAEEAERERDEAQRSRELNYEKACEWRDELLAAERRLAEVEGALEAVAGALDEAEPAARKLKPGVLRGVFYWSRDKARAALVNSAPAPCSVCNETGFVDDASPTGLAYCPSCYPAPAEEPDTK